MAIEPGPHLLVLVGGIVVEDDVDEPAGRNVAFEGIEEADELLMPMALHVPSEHLAGQDIEHFCTVETANPATLAMARVVQCVASV